MKVMNIPATKIMLIHWLAEIDIISVFHTSQQPKVWKDRVK